MAHCRRKNINIHQLAGGGSGVWWVGAHQHKSAAGMATDITLTTGIELIGPAPDFQVSCNTGGPGACSAQNLNNGAGPMSSIPVVEVISVVIPAAE